jgi:hypothetical protein
MPNRWGLANEGTNRLSDWATFEHMLAKADAEYEIIFRLFGIDGTGLINQATLQKLYNQNKGESSIPSGDSSPVGFKRSKLPKR